MAESTLALSYEDLRKEVGFYLGWQRDPDGWNTKQIESIESCVRSGLRQFYFPPVLPGMAASHEWSFLRPSVALKVPSGSLEISLPDDFGFIDGPITYGGSDTAIPSTIPVTGGGQILARRSENPSMTGRPIMAAVVPNREAMPTRGPRAKLAVWPIPGADYTFTFTYSVLPDALTDSRPYPYGGAAHAETILASCLSFAEQRLDNMMGVQKGAFLERLAASVAFDRRLKPAVLGYNGDGSDGAPMTRSDTHGFATVTVGGVTY